MRLYRWKDIRHAGMTPERIARLDQEIAAMVAALDVAAAGERGPTDDAGSLLERHRVARPTWAGARREESPPSRRT